jgi:hypothetical protein
LQPDVSSNAAAASTALPARRIGGFAIVRIKRFHPPHCAASRCVKDREFSQAPYTATARHIPLKAFGISPPGSSGKRPVMASLSEAGSFRNTRFLPPANRCDRVSTARTSVRSDTCGRQRRRVGAGPETGVEVLMAGHETLHPHGNSVT